MSAASQSAASVPSTYVVVTPHRGNTLVNSWCVEPNRARDATMWSPLRTRAAIAVNPADIPEAVTIPSSAPSSWHSLATSSSVLGLA